MIALLLTAAAPAYAHAPGIDKALPTLGEYFRLGVFHILTGFDHLVFLLGVVLIASRTRSVLLAVTAFTLAHSVTLALSVLGVASVSPRLVEPLIALSVAYVGLENFWLRDAGKRFRLTFAFGLVHGFGFAGALQEIGVPQDNAAPALAMFNLGVEAGQLLVLVVVWPTLLWLRRYPLRFGQMVRVVNVAIVVMGGAWALERTIGGEPAVAATEQTAPARAEIHHVYTTVAASPLAAKVCRATQALPRERRAACEGSQPGPTLEAECTRVLSAALASQALRVEPAAADSCVAALQDRYASCEFTQSASLQPPAACTGVWQGQLASGARCRSSLECQSGLYCHGAGPINQGTCGAPKAAGARCSLTPDTLGAYLATKDSDHPECQAGCKQGRCM
ncbi:MAG TPA: HupE/UreJ family protein [Polyangiales bacterium]|nr:HupE/UreJ family protein [Polyangiales bacterium]